MANINDTEQWRSFIWKMKNKEYKDKDKRNKTCEILLNNLKEIATLDDLKKNNYENLL